jgi:NADH-quinone oxidoreductase subunit B
MVHDLNFLIQNIKQWVIIKNSCRQKCCWRRIFATTLNDVVGMVRAIALTLPLQPLVVVLSSWLPWSPLWFSTIWFWTREFFNRYVNGGHFQKKTIPILRQVYEQRQNQAWLLQWRLCFLRRYFRHLLTPFLKELTQSYTGWRLRARLPSKTGEQIDGVMKLQELVRTENVRRRSSPEYQELLFYNIKCNIAWH